MKLVCIIFAILATSAAKVVKRDVSPAEDLLAEPSARLTSRNVETPVNIPYTLRGTQKLKDQLRSRYYLQQNYNLDGTTQRPYVPFQNIYWTTQSPALSQNYYSTTQSPAPSQNYYSTTPSPTPSQNYYSTSQKPAPSQNYYWTQSPAPSQNTYWTTQRPAPAQNNNWFTQRPTTSQNTYWTTQSPVPAQNNYWTTQRPVPAQNNNWFTQRPTTSQNTYWTTQRPTPAQNIYWTTQRPALAQNNNWSTQSPTPAQNNNWSTQSPIPSQNYYWTTQSPAPSQNYWTTTRRPYVPTQQAQNTWNQNVGMTSMTPSSVIKNEYYRGENGSYKYEYQLTDGTHVGEEGYYLNPGAEKLIPVKKGWYSYVGADNYTNLVTYVADDTGYHASYRRYRQ